MNTETSRKTPTIPFGVYKIDRKYIENLKASDNNIIAPDILDRYCGSVLQVNTDRGSIDYFVPLSYEYETANSFAMIFENGILAGFIDFNKMIPCFSQVLIPDKSNENLITFCNNIRNDIEACAKTVYQEKNAK